MTNRMSVLAARPTGMVKPTDFEVKEGAVPEPGPGEFRVKVNFASIDPAMRGWINEGRSYLPPVQIGETMRAIAIGTVEVSNNPGFPVGAAVVGMHGIQDYAVSKGENCYIVDPTKVPMERWVGGLGMPGLTAYFGTTEILKPVEGQTLVVSAASGAVGGIVGQIAKLYGACVVGIAGGPEKCAYVVDELGFDACIDYKNDDVPKAIAAHCPDRVDMYFENVGGDIGNAVFHQMNYFGRVALCGLISGYNATDPNQGGYDTGAQRSMLVNRLLVKGFIVLDFAKQYPDGMRQLGEWHAQGKLKIREDVREGGVDVFAEVLNNLYTGGNFGKLVLKL